MHFAFHAGDNFFTVPGQECHQVRNHLAVLSLGRCADAGRSAQLDIIIKTRPFILAGNDPVTRQIREDAAQHVQGLIDCPGRGIRAEIARAVFRHLPRHGDFREGVRPVNFDIRITLVVLETDVEFWPVFLDEIHLEDQRFQLRPNQDPLDVADLAHQAACLCIVAGIGVEIRPHTVAQVDGFPHVNYIACRIPVDITARLGGQGSQDSLELFGNFHADNCSTGKYSCAELSCVRIC